MNIRLDALMKIYLKIIIMGGLLYSCVTPFEPKTNFGFDQLIVNGRITNLEEQEPIILQKTRSDGLRSSVMGAEVTIFEDGTHYRLEERAEGKYFMPTALKGKPGHIYQLRITLPDGSIYSSKPEKLPISNGSGKSTFRIFYKDITDDEGTVVTKPYLKIVSNVKMDTLNQFMRWDVTETYFFYMLLIPSPYTLSAEPLQCFNTNVVNSQNFTLLHSTNPKVKSINDLEIAERVIDYTFALRHGFTIYQVSLTPEAFDYWRRIKLSISQTGSIFDTPPAPILGNISNEESGEQALGYFEVSSVTFNRFFVYPYNIPFFIPQRCTYDPNRMIESYPKQCLDCYSLPNGTFFPPKWFLE
jgi:Domain of unknown function (DUF4249)